jgi:hypothetical protein
VRDAFRRTGAGVLLALLIAACSSTKKPPLTPRPAPAPKPEERFFSGKVLRFNAEHAYVVVECAVLPRQGEEATVFRGESPVGRVRFGGKVSFPYATADLLSGSPMVGDRIRSK